MTEYDFDAFTLVWLKGVGVGNVIGFGLLSIQFEKGVHSTTQFWNTL